jgi:hypothetical protein
MDYFGAAPPPPPFLIAALRIVVQMSLVALIMLGINRAMGYFDANIRQALIMGEERRTRKRTLDLLTRSLIDMHKSFLIIVAMNKEAAAKLIELRPRFQVENLILTQSENFAAKEVPKVLCTDSVPRTAKDVEVYDLVAIDIGGQRWLGFNISEAEREKALTPKFQLCESVVDCWITHLLLGTPNYIEAKVNEIPIKFSTDSS